ncbi:MAG: glucokinase [Alphaproteobacteria bacterium]|nr:glucokinase [Alphaproteobacteria bacterium]MDE2495546.1 glucokinase [Alphaproteobacteria bacterium]
MPSNKLPKLGLVGDMGGTNARFAITAKGSDGPVLQSCATLNASNFQTPEAAISEYLSGVELPCAPHFAVIAVAGPVTDNSVTFTNLSWHLSGDAIAARFKIGKVTLINDFEALAKSIPALGLNDSKLIGREVDGLKDGIIAILGPGTGFGVSALVRQTGQETVVPTEGGHVAFAPQSDVELALWQVLRRKFGRVSVEHVLSGPGLLNLYQAFCEIDHATPRCFDPRDITVAAGEGDNVAARTIDQFCRALGSVAGDIALGLGARGGIYLAGGIAPRLLDGPHASGFRERFEAKGRLESYVKAIPTRMIAQPYAALIGAARYAPNPAEI